MKFGTLLTNLAKKSGVDTTQKEFIDLLAVDIEVPDAIAAGLEKGLMNLEAAKNHPDLRKAARAEALNGVDSRVAELLEEFQIEDADDITGEKNSFEKISKLTRKVKELEGKKAGASKNVDKVALEATIADLNKQIKTVKDSLTAKEKEFSETRESDLTNFDIHKRLLGRNYNLPTEMDADLKLTTAQSAVNKELAKKGFKIVRDAESGSLKIVNKEGAQAYSDKNEPLEVETFIDGALAQNKLLKVTDDQSQNNNGGGNNNNPHIPGGGQQQNPIYQQRVAELDKEIAELTK